MLPYDVQNILSLQQNKLRYSFSVYITINKEGLINKEKTRLVHNTITIAKNFTYEEADRILAHPEKEATCDPEIIPALVVLSSLAEKLAKLRDELGLKIDLDDQEDQKIEKSSAAHRMVEQFMMLANEAVTDYFHIKYQAIEKRLVEIRNNEKKLAKANRLNKILVAKKEKVDRTDSHTKEDLDRTDSHTKEDLDRTDSHTKEDLDRTDSHTKEDQNKETPDEPTIDSDIEPSADQHNVEAIEEEEVLISDEETVPETDEESQTSESEEDDDDDLNHVNLSQIQENSAKAACRFLEILWKSVDKQKVFDLSSQKNFSASIKSMMDDDNIKQSIKIFLKHELKINIRNTDLVIRKKLDIHGDKTNKDKIVNSSKDVSSKDISHGDLSGNNDNIEIEAYEHSEVTKGSNMNNQNSIEEVDKSTVETRTLDENKIDYSPKDAQNEKQNPLEETKLDVETRTLDENKIEYYPKDAQNEKQNPLEETKLDINNKEATIVREKPKKNTKGEIKSKEPKKLTKAEKSIKSQEKPEKSKIKKENIDPRLQDTEQLMKRYNKLKEIERFKFTSPIRRFHDVLVHYLVQDLLDIEKSILNLEKRLEEKVKKELIKQDGLGKEKSAKEKCDNEEEIKVNEHDESNEKIRTKKTKKKKKEKKIRSRYQIFQKMDKNIKSKLDSIKKSQKRIKVYLEENSLSNERGMDNAEREIEIMEICKRIIPDCEFIMSSAIIINLGYNKLSVFLIEFSQNCVLNNRCLCRSDKWMVKLENGEEIEVKLFDDIEVKITVKPSFPLSFNVDFHRLHVDMPSAKNKKSK